MVGVQVDPLPRWSQRRWHPSTAWCSISRPTRRRVGKRDRADVGSRAHPCGGDLREALPPAPFRRG